MPISPKDVLTDPKFQALTPAQRQQVLMRIDPDFSKLSPEAQMQVVSRQYKAAAAAAAPSIHTPPTGVAGIRAGLYTNAYKLADLIKNNLDVMGGTLGGLAPLVGAAGTVAAPEVGIPLAVVGSFLGGASGKSVQKLLGLSKEGPSPSTGTDISDIAIAGGEQAASELIGGGLGKVGKMIRPQSRAALLSYGTRAGELAPKLDKLAPDFDRTISRLGLKRPETIGELGQVVNETERGFNNEFGLAVAPIRNQPMPANTVADAIRSKITPNMAKTRVGLAGQRYLLRRAAEFDGQTWTVGELNAERELVSKRLRAWHKALGSGQATQARVQEKIAADTAAEEALRDLIYNAADRSGVRPPGYFRALKQKQSELISVMDAMEQSRSNLIKSSAEGRGAPLSEKVHLRTYLHPTSMTPGGVAGVTPSMFRDPLQGANKAISKAFPGAGRKAWRATREVTGKALSQRDIDALPLRALFGDYSQPEAAQ